MTRLAATIGEVEAAEIHARLTRHILSITTSSGLCPVELWCANNPEHAFFNQCQLDFPVRLQQQQGDDLGERMAHAFAETLKEADQVICIGCDCPALTAADLEQALVSLGHGYDCVLKPAEDGGYVLIGLNSVAKDVFQGIPWGSDTVMQETRTKLKSLGYRHHELATTWDLDRPADLDRLDALCLLP